MARLRPFRFGVFAEGVRSREALLDTARRAEDAGFATFLIRDHFIAEPFGDQLAPLTTLATVAGMTRTLRIGSLVFANDYRHPVVLAKEVATLDVLSEGRVELGVGAGFSRAEYEQAGMAFDPPSVRVERLEEALQVIKGLFSDTPFTFVGQHYSVSGLNSFPKPLQRPHPPNSSSSNSLPSRSPMPMAPITRSPTTSGSARTARQGAISTPRRRSGVRMILGSVRAFGEVTTRRSSVARPTAPIPAGKRRSRPRARANSSVDAMATSSPELGSKRKITA